MHEHSPPPDPTTGPPDAQDRKGKRGAPRPGAPREDRLKAALKANMARRKAQARARAAQDNDNNSDKDE